MVYTKLLDTLAALTNVRVEKKILRRPEGRLKWGYSDNSDIVTEIYITNFSKNPTYKNYGSFGSWVHGDTDEEASKKALIQLLKSLKWSYKVKIEKWLES